MRRKYLLVLTVLLLLPAVALAETYDIVMSRTARAGDRYSVAATAQSVSRAEAPGKRSPTVTERRLAISGELEMLEVRASGRASRSRLTVSHFEGTENGKPVAGLAEGAVVTAQLEGEDTVYRVNGEPAEEGLSELLKMVLHYRRDDIPDDQAFFGTDQPRAVGEAWPVNAAVAAETLSRDKLTVEPGDVTGQTRLVDLTDVDGTPCLRIAGEVTVTDVEMELPKMAQLTSSRLVLAMEGDYPRDTDLPPTRVKSTSDLDMQLRGTGLLASVRFSVTEQRTVERRLRLIARGPEAKPAPDTEELPDGETTGWRVLRSE